MTFRQFVDRVAPRYKWYRHCEILADVLQRVADGEIKRLMVFMPPRHGKSELVSRLFAAYYLHRFPEKWVGINSYGAELAYTLSRAARDNYKASGGITRSDADAVKQWETGQGGGLWAAGVGGPITGKGFHLGIIDDPIKNRDDANSDTIRAGQKDWYSSTFYTREEPNDEGDPDGAIVVIQTRWHEDDLSGWLLSEEKNDDESPEGWHIVCFEAIKEAEPQAFPDSCTVEPDWRQEGEALCPQRRPLEKLRRIWRRIGDYFWQALFQQRPTAREGSFFKVSQLEIVEAVPARLREVRAWDVGATAGAGDYTAGVKIGTNGDGVYYVTDVKRGQWSTDERDKIIKQTAELDGTAVKQRLPQDPGAAGKSLASSFVKLVAGYPVVTKPVSGDKQTRADPFSSQVNAGNVKLLKASWNRDYIEELRQFPMGKYDDQIDASADAFDETAKPLPTSGKKNYDNRDSNNNTDDRRTRLLRATR